MNIRGIDISTGNVEDILAVLDILVADLSNTKDEIKELENSESQKLEKLIKALQKAKEEFSNSSFTLLEKNTKLFNKSTNILTKIDKLSIFLENLENSIKKEKLTFDNEIKQKMQNMLKNVETNLNSLKLTISNKKADFEREFKQIEKLYSDNNAKLSSLTQETKKIGQEYQETLKNSLNGFKKQIEEYKKEFEDEIKQKTFFQRWGAVTGAVTGAFSIGVAVSFIFLIPTIKSKIKADKIVQVEIVKIKDKKAQEIIAKLNNKISKIKKENENKINKLNKKIVELKKWQIPNKYILSGDKYWYIGVPYNNLETINGKDYCFAKLFRK